jgi:hypothetical protein
MSPVLTLPLPTASGSCVINLFSALHHISLFCVLGQVDRPDMGKPRSLALEPKMLVSESACAKGQRGKITGRIDVWNTMEKNPGEMVKRKRASYDIKS